MDDIDETQLTIGWLSLLMIGVVAINAVATYILAVDSAPDTTPLFAFLLSLLLDLPLIAFGAFSVECLILNLVLVSIWRISRFVCRRSATAQ
jgi:hypothetical protein